MMKFKTSLLVATTVAAIAVASSASAATDPFIGLSTVLGDASVTNVAQSPAAPLSLADNPFAIEAPGNPQSVAANGGTAPTATTGTDIYGTPTYTPGTGYTIFDGDYAIHGVGSTAVQNVLARAMNCFGTPQVLGNGQAVAAGTATTGGSVSGKAAVSYAGSPALNCDNGSFSTVTGAGSSAPYTFTAPTGGIFYGYASNDQSKALYYVPGTNVNSAQIQPQFSDYSVTTGNLAPYGFAGKYIGSGSGLGQKAWEYGTDVFDDGYGKTTSQLGSTGNVPNPFVSIVGQNAWSHVQFAASDAPLVSSQLALYSANAGVKGGNAIQFPLFVTPISIVYNTVYGKKPAGTLLTFNAKGSATYSSGKVAALQLSGSLYCGIFNGMITNWNDPALTQQNKNTPLYDPLNDNATRWNTQGAPIRLVARMDNSGSTDIFTRHLAAVCSQSAIYGSSTTSGSNYFTAAGVTSPLLPVADKKNFVPNKYLQNAQSVPYNAGPSFTTLRSDTHLNGSAYSSANDAGSVNTVSGDYWTGSTIANIGSPSSLPTKYNGSGLFIVANGGSAVGALINFAPDYDAVTGTQGNTTSANILFNGKIGYLSVDNVTGKDAIGTPTTGFLRSAVLATLPNSYSAVGGIYAYTYVAPTLKNALSAFNTTTGSLAFLPPESDSTGTFVPALTNVATPSGGYAVRSNPLAWTDALYPATTSYGSGLLAGKYTLAQPSQGYPIVGTTQLLTYQCFYSKGNREAIATLVGTLTGQLTVDSTNTKINKTAFSSSSAALPGVIGSSNIGIVPSAWQVALARTFLSGTSDVNTSTTGGGLVGTATSSVGYSASPLNFTSSLVPTKVKVSAGVFTYTPTLPNASCLENGNGSGTIVGL